MRQDNTQEQTKKTYTRPTLTKLGNAIVNTLGSWEGDKEEVASKTGIISWN